MHVLVMTTDAQLLDAFEQHYSVADGDPLYDRTALLRGLRAASGVPAQDDDTVERLAAHLYSLSPVWSYARAAAIPWDDPEPGWIDKGFWRERARAAMAVVFTDPAAVQEGVIA